MTKTACITGITGQTGSYLAELLLQKGFKVFGLKRRSSSLNTERIDHIYSHPNLKLVYGDLSDYSSIVGLLKNKPDYFFNLGAQSHVKVSFDVPEYSFDVDGTGVIRALEAIRQNSPTTRFLQASSSEMFGSSPPPQNETTIFHPRSPYAVAKVAGYHAVVNYREAFNLFACNAISFNHECLSSNTPVIVRIKGVVDVVSVADLIPLKRRGRNTQTYELRDIEIWDGNQWTELKTITATKYRRNDKNQKLISVQARAGIVECTSHHNMLDENFIEKRADAFNIGDKIALTNNFPQLQGWTIISEEMGEFLGYLVSEGYVSERTAQFTNNDNILLNRVKELWFKLFLGTSHLYDGVSGFDQSKKVKQLRLNGCSTICGWLKNQIYTPSGLKKVPTLVLNAPINIQEAFLKGYYAGDGLKAGNGESVKTNSSFLAQGLCWIYFNKGNLCSTYVEHRNNAAYYQLNILTDSSLGQHLRKDPSEVRKVTEAIVFDDWVFDVETGTSVLMAGVGRVVVHNSPRRGETFVTRKITQAATRIKLGLQDKLYLGNLEAKRDWSHAKDVASAMIKIIESDSADDYVVASGEMHSVREFAEVVFDKLGLNWKDYVEIDPIYFRPSEVDALCGDSSKLRNQLGWQPEYSFTDLVDEMIDSDLESAKKEKILKDNSK